MTVTSEPCAVPAVSGIVIDNRIDDGTRGMAMDGGAVRAEGVEKDLRAASAFTGAIAGDGRSARGERTRRAVIDAHISLIQSGELKPTGAQVAARAGVSLRSLWGHFGDLETLFAATGSEIMRRQGEAHVPVDPDLPFDDRIERFCRQRAERLEFVAPFARSSEIRAPFSRELQRYRFRYFESAVTEAEILFSRELAGLDDGARSEILQSVGVCTTWPMWVSLRDVLHLQVPAATAVMTRAVSALLRDADTGPSALHHESA